MKALPTFSHPMEQFSLLPRPRSLLPNPLHLLSLSMLKLKSQRVPMIRTEILRQALVKLLRLSLLLPKDNNLLRLL